MIRIGPKPADAPPASAIPPAAKPEKLAALPPPNATPRAATAAPEKPQIAVIRGGRQQAASPRMPTAEKSKLASLPPVTHPPTASDAPPIIVLRGGRNTRYALASSTAALPPPAHPILNIIRGARPRLVLYPYVQPGPLILRIPD